MAHPPTGRRIWFARAITAGLLVVSAFLPWGDFAPYTPFREAVELGRRAARESDVGGMAHGFLSTVHLAGPFLLAAVTWGAAIPASGQRPPKEWILAWAAVVLVVLPTIGAAVSPTMRIHPFPGFSSGIAGVLGLGAIAVTAYGAFRRWADPARLIQAGAVTAAALYVIFNVAMDAGYAQMKAGLLVGTAGALGWVVATYSACVTRTEERWRSADIWRRRRKKT